METIKSKNHEDVLPPKACAFTLRRVTDAYDSIGILLTNKDINQEDKRLHFKRILGAVGLVPVLLDTLIDCLDGTTNYLSNYDDDDV